MIHKNDKQTLFFFNLGRNDEEFWILRNYSTILKTSIKNALARIIFGPSD